MRECHASDLLVVSLFCWCPNLYHFYHFSFTSRGVSGGQRRRVTVGEMMVGQNAVACADEISTGLDAAVTYDIVRYVTHMLLLLWLVLTLS